MTDHQLELLLLDLAVIVVLAGVAGFVARKLGQPAVIGEIVLGILLGPTLFSGGLSRTLFPTEVRPFLSALANVGLALFMFTVGAYLENTGTRVTRRTTLAVAIGAAVLPFGLGTALAVFLAGHHHSVSSPAFILFIGVTLSITAFPVLARIITERRLTGTAVGSIALSAAAGCDVVAWSLLAFAQALAAQNFVAHWQTLLLIPFVAFMFWFVRPMAARFLESGSMSPAIRSSVVFAGILASAGATQLMGLHLVFGAFLFGMIMPKTGRGEHWEAVSKPLEFVAKLLLPVYFITTGFSVDLTKLDLTGVVDLILILVLAIGGKVGGAYLGARTVGVQSRQAFALGALMNTRGLTELVALGVGLQAGLLDQQLYGILVLMALVTTAMAGPLLTLISRNGDRAGVDVFEVEPPAPAKAGV